MMLQAMPCLASSSPAKLPASAHPAQHSFLGDSTRRSRLSFMRKRVELARQGCRLLETQSRAGSHYLPTAAYQRNDLARRQRGGDPQHTQTRHGSSGTSQLAWERKNLQDRDRDERRRTQQSSFSSLAHKQRITRQTTFAATPARPPNDPWLAQARAHPDDAAQPSHAWPAADSFKRNSRFPLGVNGHHPQRPAVVAEGTATHPSPTDIEQAVDVALSQDDLHSAALSHLSSLKVLLSCALVFLK